VQPALDAGKDFWSGLKITSRHKWSVSQPEKHSAWLTS